MADAINGSIPDRAIIVNVICIINQGGYGHRWNVNKGALDANVTEKTRRTAALGDAERDLFNRLQDVEDIEIILVPQHDDRDASI